MKRKYVATIILEQDCETIAEGLINAKSTLALLGLKGEVKPVKSIRSLNQNASLHLWFTMIEEEARNTGQTMDMLIQKPNELPITASLLKDMFRLIGETMHRKNSTAKLSKDEFSSVVSTFEKIVAERLNISLDYPSIETLIYKQ